MRLQKKTVRRKEEDGKGMKWLEHTDDKINEHMEEKEKQREGEESKDDMSQERSGGADPLASNPQAPKWRWQESTSSRTKTIQADALLLVNLASLMI